MLLKVFIFLLCTMSVSLAETKVFRCRAEINSIDVDMIITHNEEDFFKDNVEIKSSVKLKILGFEYELENKTANLKNNKINFSTDQDIPYIGQSFFKIKNLFLYDAISGENRDDFFFGRLTHDDSEKSKFITNYENFGGQLVIHFLCY